MKFMREIATGPIDAIRSVMNDYDKCGAVGFYLSKDTINEILSGAIDEINIKGIRFRRVKESMPKKNRSKHHDKR